MNKELFYKILNFVENEFNDFNGFYRYIKSRLHVGEKDKFEKFEPFVTNIYYRKFCIGDDYASLYTSDKDEYYILSVSELASGWKEKFPHSHLIFYHSQDHEGNSTYYEIKLKKESDKYYLNLEIRSWDIGLGDYEYIKNIKSRTLSSYEIDKFLTQSSCENEK